MGSREGGDRGRHWDVPKKACRLGFQSYFGNLINVCGGGRKKGGKKTSALSLLQFTKGAVGCGSNQTMWNGSEPKGEPPTILRLTGKTGWGTQTNASEVFYYGSKKRDGLGQGETPQKGKRPSAMLAERKQTGTGETNYRQWMGVAIRGRTDIKKKSPPAKTVLPTCPEQAKSKGGGRGKAGKTITTHTSAGNRRKGGRIGAHFSGGADVQKGHRGGVCSAHPAKHGYSRLRGVVERVNREMERARCSQQTRPLKRGRLGGRGGPEK